jgi:NADP-dependent 3-hydroxy acid dehydrogenase YdfG
MINFSLTDRPRMADTDVTALRTMAGGVIREFKERGYGLRHIIVLASELIGLACEAVRSDAPTIKT